ncbi:MAG: acetate--CoA ligase family protein [Chloroflexota bacterium]
MKLLSQVGGGEGRRVLTEIEAKELLKVWGVKVVETCLAHSQSQAVALSRELGFPVALKIASPDITHKSDAGGVKLGLTSQSQVTQAYRDVIRSAHEYNPQAHIQGVTVQKMAPPGVEVIAGMSTDPQFGPVLMFGLGGVWVEVLKDVAFRLIPISPKDAREMISEIKGFPLLQGYRGHEPVDTAALEEVLLDVSQMVEMTPAIRELDINPLFAYKQGVVAVDARVVVEE